MKATIMLQGMLQMLDFLGEDSIVTISIKLEDGSIITTPLKSVKSGTSIEGVLLTNY
jgi:hypothetical protein